MRADDIYAQQRQHLLRLARLLVRDDATAEQVVDESFAAARGDADSFPNPDAAVTYLRQSVVNRSRLKLRQRRGMDGTTPPPEPD